MATKRSKLYYATRGVVRVLVKLFLMLAAYTVLHLAAYNLWTALFFMFIVASGFIIYEHRTQPVTVPVES